MPEDFGRIVLKAVAHIVMATRVQHDAEFGHTFVEREQALGPEIYNVDRDVEVRAEDIEFDLATPVIIALDPIGVLDNRLPSVVESSLETSRARDYSVRGDGSQLIDLICTFAIDCVANGMELARIVPWH